MREFLKKLGSLSLGVSALSLVLANAAITHGCARSPSSQATPQAPPAAHGPVPGSGKPMAGVEPTESEDPCEPPEYMHATKAPVWIPPGCRGGDAVPAREAPSSSENAAQQAP
jgi:hypothetical protein